MTEIEVRLYDTRQRLSDKIAATRDKPDCTAEVDQCVQQIDKINIILTRLAERDLIKNWPTEFETT